MKGFQNILFVSQGLVDESESLKQALSIARNNNAQLKVLILCPKLPKKMADYKEQYELSLVQKLQESINLAREAVKVSEAEVPLQIDVDSNDVSPAIRIVRQILKNDFDLLVKEAEIKEGGKGFKAVDMDLLRKCPCPVFLSRPISRHRNEIKLAVAIDPSSESSEEKYLSLKLLKLARSLADTCDGKLNIISCWEYEYEQYLKGNVWIKVSDSEIAEQVSKEGKATEEYLGNLIAKSAIQGEIQINHIRGKPENIIPKFVADENIDILIMGTLGRTGIPGFVIGNTSENIVQKLPSSLLALKPNGFVSPIKL